jgi:lipoprotein signal peptidase
MNGPSASSRIVLLAGLTILAIAIYQTVTDGRPDQYTIGAVLALALGGGVGRIADGLVKGYVASQVEAARRELRNGNGTRPAPDPPAAPPSPLPPDRDAP